MIVVCPNCSSKYSVPADAIGVGKLVRCAVCGTTWQQTPVKEKKSDEVMALCKSTLYWFTVFITLFSLFISPQTVSKYWPASASFYKLIGFGDSIDKKAFSIKNVSSFFVKRNGRLYMGIKGELSNISNEVQMVPKLVIGLKDDTSAEFKASWTHELNYKKLLPNQKIIFETDLKSVPYTNLICDIKLNTL
jgi:predicted Zn finger-like uncharacterized protein